MPLLLIVATETVDELHVPPLTVLLRVDVAPTQIVVTPVIVPAERVLTVKPNVAVAVPQPVVTV